MNKHYVFIASCLLLLFAGQAWAAYHHMGEIDSPHFLAIHDDAAGTKLDNCATCHAGGEYEKRPGVFIKMGSCQWCHHVTEYGTKPETYGETLNSYGKDYLDYGRDEAAIASIASMDSDGDGFSNAEEIDKLSYPGNAEDDPTLVYPPSVVFDMNDIEAMPSHHQVQLMNTHKSGDYYAGYTGVTIQKLLEKAGMLESAESITVFAPDGWSHTFPLRGEGAPNDVYPMLADYPNPVYYYTTEADKALTDYGWCDYSSPEAANLVPGETLPNPDGVKAILAYRIDGEYLTPGVLDEENRLNGDGPYRLVPPQVTPSSPDQASTAENQDVIWPFTEEWDHNAGFSPRSVTMIRVDPLPEGTTDINILEAGWNYIDEKKVVIYGAIDDGVDSGCTMQRGSAFSPALTGLVLAALGLISLRRRKRRS